MILSHQWTLDMTKLQSSLLGSHNWQSVAGQLSTWRGTASKSQTVDLQKISVGDRITLSSLSSLSSFIPHIVLEHSVWAE